MLSSARKASPRARSEGVKYWRRLAWAEDDPAVPGAARPINILERPGPGAGQCWQTWADHGGVRTEAGEQNQTDTGQSGHSWSQQGEQLNSCVCLSDDQWWGEETGECDTSVPSQSPGPGSWVMSGAVTMQCWHMREKLQKYRVPKPRGQRARVPRDCEWASDKQLSPPTDFVIVKWNHLIVTDK